MRFEVEHAALNNVPILIIFLPANWELREEMVDADELDCSDATCIRRKLTTTKNAIVIC